MTPVNRMKNINSILINELIRCNNLLAEIKLTLGRVDLARILINENKQHIKKISHPDPSLILAFHSVYADLLLEVSDAQAALREIQLSLPDNHIADVDGTFNKAGYYDRLARYYNFKIMIDSAYHFAKMSVDLCKEKKLNPANYPIYKFKRTESYAYKIKFRTEKGVFIKKSLEARAMLDIALNDCILYHGNENIFAADIYRGIGNIYTDISLTQHLKNQKPPLQEFRKGSHYYDISESLLKRYAGADHPNIGTLHFVKSLLYNYTFGNDSLNAILYEMQQGISVLGVQLRPDGSTEEASLRNCHFKYELLLYFNHMLERVLICYRLNRTDKDYLAFAYKISHHNLILWDLLCKESESDNAHQLIALYASTPFTFMTDVNMQLYEKTNNKKYLEEIFQIAETSKNAVRERLIWTKNIKTLDSHFNKNLNIAQIQKLLPDSSALIYFIGNEYLFAVSKQLTTISRNSSTDVMVLKVDSIRLAIQENDVKKYAEISYRFYEETIGKALSKMKDIKRLYICPDSRYGEVPFPALVISPTQNPVDFRDLNYLAKSYSTQLILSVNDIVTTVKKSLTTLSTCTPDFSKHSKLIFSMQLPEQLSTFFKEIIHNELPGKKSLLSSIYGNTDAFLISTHSEINSNDIMKSKLFLNDSSESISLDEVLQTKNNFALAILLACETGTGTFEYGEGLMSFSRAFLYTGSKTTLSTLWRVDDKASASQVLNFTHNINGKALCSEVLQKTQLEFLKNAKTSTEANPYYWSGYITTGIDQLFYFPSNPIISWKIIAALGSLLLASAFYFIRKRKNN